MDEKDNDSEIGVMIHYTSKTLSCDWDGNRALVKSKVFCIACNERVGRPFVSKGRKIFIFKNVLFRIGNRSLSIDTKELTKYKCSFVSEAFWKLIQAVFFFIKNNF